MDASTPSTTSDSEHESDNLPGDHSMTVMAVQPGDGTAENPGTITIRNPWGNNGSFAPTDAYDVQGDTGIFTFEIPQFEKDFGAVTIQR